ncbi:MAG: hypothetical protein ABL953_08830 [Ilumatobacteraceae bacterium]
MNEQSLEEAWWLLSRTRGAGLLLRVLVVVSPVTALMCTRFAADHSPRVVNISVIVLAVLCAAFPDGHMGLLVVLLVATQWFATVDSPTTPWSIAVAVLLTVFHSSLAAATVAPPAARWTRAMCRRWLLRPLAVMLASAATWAVIAATHRYEIASSDVLIAAALVGLAVAGMWARNGTLAARQFRQD